MSRYEDNIELAAFRLKRAGYALDSRWYDDARAWVGELAKAARLDIGTAAGIVAALSPRNRWDAQVETTLSWIEQSRYEDKPAGANTFGRNRENAFKILCGLNPRLVLMGPKTLAFYRALAGNAFIPVVDTWMFYLATWGKKEGGGKAMSRDVTHALIRVAKRFHVTPQQLQATLWEYVREHGLPIDVQRCLPFPENH